MDGLENLDLHYIGCRCSKCRYQRMIDAIQDFAERAGWNSKPPEKEGWYWVREDELDDDPQAMRVFKRPGHEYLAIWCPRNQYLMVEKLPSYLWAGPIEPPEIPPLSPEAEELANSP